MQRDGAGSAVLLFDIVKNETASGGALHRLAGFVCAWVAPSASPRLKRGSVPSPRFRLRQGYGGPSASPHPPKLQRRWVARGRKARRCALCFPPLRSGGGGAHEVRDGGGDAGINAERTSASRRTRMNCTLRSPVLRRVRNAKPTADPCRNRLKCAFQKWSRNSPPVFHPVSRGRCVHPKWQRGHAIIPTLRYDKASATCTRVIAVDTARSAIVRATRRTR
jgi:hypothetical protein